jgi:hypothetical protein
MSLEDEIEEFRKTLTQVVEGLEEVRWLSNKLTESPVEDLYRHLTQLQDLCDQISIDIKRTGNRLAEINDRWGSEPLKSISPHLSSINSDLLPLLLKESSVSTAIHYTQGGHKKHLDRYYWPSKDGKEMQQYRETLETREKRFISQIQGESLGHCYVTEILGYEEFFHGDSKSISQGLDGIYLDPHDNALIVVEFKGQRSSESKAQQQSNWSLETCKKIQRYTFPYNRVSDSERDVAIFILKEYEAGRIIRYEVIRSEVDPQSGQMWTQLEKRTYLEQGLSSP